MRAPLALLVLVLSLGWALLSPAATTPAEDAPHPPRKWMLGIQGVTVRQGNHDVFDHPTLPGETVEDEGHGAGLQFGRRFGDRFVLGLQLTAAGQELAAEDWDLVDVEALITGTVLFREYDTLQPFLRGSFGGGGTVLFLPGDAGNLFSFGTVAGVGGGLNVQLSRGFSLELEGAATFNNILEVRNESDDPRFPDEESWQVRTSRQGWRVGVGVQIWF